MIQNRQNLAFRGSFGIWRTNYVLHTTITRNTKVEISTKGTRTDFGSTDEYIKGARHIDAATKPENIKIIIETTKGFKSD